MGAMRISRQAGSHAHRRAAEPLPHETRGLSTDGMVAPLKAAPVVLNPVELVRFADQPVRGSDLARMTRGIERALNEAFVPWLNQPSSSTKSFEDMLKAMHSAAVEEGYSGNVGGVGQVKRLEPGQMLHELYPPEHRHWLVVNPRIIPEAARADSLFEVPAGASRVPLEGFPEEAWGLNVRTAPFGMTQVEHYYMPVAYHPQAIERLASLMTTMRDGSIDRSARLDAMAEFHHLAIQVQIFPRVNNSLLMAMINTLLHREGLLGIAHGVLDYDAKFMGLEAYRPRFLEAIAARNEPGVVPAG